MNTYFSKTIGKKADWIWDWVEYNQKHPGKMVEWFHQCSKKELATFVNEFTYYIDYNLTAPNEGVWIKELDGPLSEDAQEDFNNWIIVQGKEIWEVASDESLERVLDGYVFGPNPKDDELEHLYKIYDECTKADYTPKLTTWKGISWHPKKGNFPGGSAYWIYKERFGEYLPFPS